MAEQKKTKKALILKDFKDTNFDHTDIERKFEAGKTEDLPEGVFANYAHAGLVRELGADDHKKTAAPTA